MALQIEEDQLKELLRNLLALGDVGDQEGPFRRLLGQKRQRPQRVFRPVREHEKTLFIQ
jgi:hypothetical protein